MSMLDALKSAGFSVSEEVIEKDRIEKEREEKIADDNLRSMGRLHRGDCISNTFTKYDDGWKSEYHVSRTYSKNEKIILQRKPGTVLGRTRFLKSVSYSSMVAANYAENAFVDIFGLAFVSHIHDVRRPYMRADSENIYIDDPAAFKHDLDTFIDKMLDEFMLNHWNFGVLKHVDTLCGETTARKGKETVVRKRDDVE